MFATLEGTVDQARERRREARRRELRSLCEQEARIKQRVTEIVREADDEGDWEAAGCSSSAQWLAQISSSDYRTAARITQHEQRAAQPAGARPRAQHRRADPRPGRSRAPSTRHPRPTRNSREWRSARRPARSSWRRARSPRPRSSDDQELYQRRCAEHDLDARAARARVQRAPAARAGQRLRAGHLGYRQAPARARQAGRHRSSTGSSRPRMRSSRSPG